MPFKRITDEDLKGLPPVEGSDGITRFAPAGTSKYADASEAEKKYSYFSDASGKIASQDAEQ